MSQISLGGSIPFRVRPQSNQIAQGDKCLRQQYNQNLGLLAKSFWDPDDFLATIYLIGQPPLSEKNLFLQNCDQMGDGCNLTTYSLGSLLDEPLHLFKGSGITFFAQDNGHLGDFPRLKCRQLSPHTKINKYKLKEDKNFGWTFSPPILPISLPSKAGSRVFQLPLRVPTL